MRRLWCWVLFWAGVVLVMIGKFTFLVGDKLVDIGAMWVIKGVGGLGYEQTLEKE